MYIRMEIAGWFWPIHDWLDSTSSSTIKRCHMRYFTTLVLWTDEQFDEIRPVVESSLNFTTASHKEGGTLWHDRIVIATRRFNQTVSSQIQHWVQDFGSRCATRNVELVFTAFDAADPCFWMLSGNPHNNAPPPQGVVAIPSQFSASSRQHRRSVSGQVSHPKVPVC